MAELLVEDYPFGFRKLNDCESIDAAEKEMLARFDGGMEEDFLIKDSGMEFHYPSYKLVKETCPRCSEEERVFRMFQTRDYHGIPFRRVCSKCYNKVLARGYDGEKYGPEDECLDYDY